MATFSLINLISSDSFDFQYFPPAVNVQRRANWSPQDITIGVKPLFFANREPVKIDIPEAILDSTATGDSLTPTLEKLAALHKETEKGTPPPLLAMWGDQSLRCVLEDMEFQQEKFSTEGVPLRVKLRLTLMEVQDDVEATSVKILD